jgi:hypothetical protein
MESGMSMVKAGEASGIAGDVLGEATHITFTAAREQWK